MEKLGERAETFFAKLAELPMDEMLEDVRKALQSLREVLSSPDLKGALAGAHRAADGARGRRSPTRGRRSPTRAP